MTLKQRDDTQTFQIPAVLARHHLREAVFEGLGAYMWPFFVLAVMRCCSVAQSCLTPC